MAENFSLAERYPLSTLESVLVPLSEWRPFPQSGDRSAWEGLPRPARDAVLALANQYLECDVPSLPATLYLEYQRIGNRSRYQNVWYARRRMLHGLVLAECVEGDGRFLDQMANVIWAICEESSWAFPAHVGAQRAGVGLPDTTEPIVALFSAETASLLAWTEYLVGDRLDSVSPQIGQRIRREVDQRILTPFLTREGFGWMGFKVRADRRHPNNWNPWINSNVLAAALLLEEDVDRRLAMTHKVLRCVDNFLVPYPSDGSCDEGPSYWGRAGASLFDCLEWLHSATNGKVDVYAEPVIREIGRFIMRAHIAGDYFVNVGDCDAKIRITPDLIFRFGRRIDDLQLQRLASYELDETSLLDFDRKLQSMGRTLPLLFDLNELLALDRTDPPALRDVWLSDPELQLMAARDRTGSVDGLFVASWAGHNAQSHNHNDVGNFIVYLDGQPVIIDVGRPTYSRQTFSRDRYKIWAMQSAYHNLPSINGKTQSAGTRYAAKDVRYRSDDRSAQLTMDIAPSYPRDTGLISWRRTVRLVRGHSVDVADTFDLREPSAEIVQHLMTVCDVSQDEPGRLVLTHASQRRATVVEYTPAKLSVDVETIELTDTKLQDIWGPCLHRIILRGNTQRAEGTRALRFVPTPRTNHSRS